VSLGLGVAIIALWFVTRPVAIAAPATTPTGPAAGVAGFAELYVATYLTAAGAGAPDALEAFLAGPSDVTAMTPRARYVPHAATIDVAALGDGYWAATVAVEVLERLGDGYTPAGIHHYAVTIAEGPGGLVATGLPSRVASPRVAVPAGTYADLRVEADDELMAFAAGFVDALVADSGGLARYVASGSGIEPLDPAPYVDTELLEVRTGMVSGDHWAEILVAGTTAAGTAEVVNYTIQLTGTEERLRVAVLLPGPPPVEGDPGA
jgi:hypothetical protein